MQFLLPESLFNVDLKLCGIAADEALVVFNTATVYYSVHCSVLLTISDYVYCHLMNIPWMWGLGCHAPLFLQLKK